MLERFRDYITKKKLIHSKDNILVAVSGGVDSTVLCDLLSREKLHFAIAHCNFKLRGDESNEDEKFVKKIAEKYQVPFYTKNFNASEYASLEKISIQMAARDLRYHWFDQIAASEGFNKIAIAHHQNDTVETILLNLTRGTGISGMHGIKALKGKIIRPLLFAQRTEIEEYAKTQELAYRKDSSNESLKYQRNLIRKEVIPILKNLNPNLEATFINSIEKIEAVENIFFQKVEETKAKILKEEDGVTTISLKKLLEETEPLIQLFEILKPYNFNYTELKNILEVKKNISGKRIESSSHVLVKDRERLVITELKQSPDINYNIVIGDKKLETPHFMLTFSVENTQEFSIPKNKEIACLDYDKLGFPLTLRKWKEGDRFHPLGMNKKKKISDFLIDQKIPLNLKERIMVLTNSTDEIIWVVGLRPDNKFKITSESKRVFCARVE